MTPSAGSVRWCPPETVHVTLDSGSGRCGPPEDYGCVIQSAWFGEGDLPSDCGHVIQGAWYGRGSP